VVNQGVGGRRKGESEEEAKSGQQRGGREGSTNALDCSCSRKSEISFYSGASKRREAKETEEEGSKAGENDRQLWSFSSRTKRGVRGLGDLMAPYLGGRVERRERVGRHVCKVSKMGVELKCRRGCKVGIRTEEGLHFLHKSRFSREHTTKESYRNVVMIVYLACRGEAFLAPPSRPPLPSSFPSPS
jgi:hypothetical protein